MRSLQIKAILAGVFTDVLGSMGVAVLMSVMIAAIALYTGDMSHEHLAALKANLCMEAAGLLGTTLCTGLGGYIAARLSPFTDLNNSLAVGVVSLLLGIVIVMFNPRGFAPMWKIVVGLLSTVPAALVGGQIVMRSRKVH